LSLRTWSPKNYSGPRVLTSVSAQQLPKTDVVDAVISKLLLLSFYICSFPITSQSPSSLCFLFVSAAFQSPRNLQAPCAFFLYLQISNHLTISKLLLLSFCIYSFLITSQILWPLLKGVTTRDNWQSSIQKNCRNPNLAKCGGEAQHLEKLGIWSPSGLPNVQSSTEGPKTTRIGVFLVSLERSWSVNIENALTLGIWTSVAQVMGKRRAGSQTGSLTPDH